MSVNVTGMPDASRSPRKSRRSPCGLTKDAMRPSVASVKTVQPFDAGEGVAPPPPPPQAAVINASTAAERTGVDREQRVGPAIMAGFAAEGREWAVGATAGNLANMGVSLRKWLWCRRPGESGVRVRPLGDAMALAIQRGSENRMRASIHVGSP